MLPPLLNKFSGFLQRRPRQERRGTKRLTPGGLTPCLLRAADADEPSAAWIHNLSQYGVGIISATALLPGTLIHVLIVNTAHTCSLSIEAKVVRCTRTTGGHFLLGGEFTNPVQHTEILPFLR